VALFLFFFATKTLRHKESQRKELFLDGQNIFAGSNVHLSISC